MLTVLGLSFKKNSSLWKWIAIAENQVRNTSRQTSSLVFSLIQIQIVIEKNSPRRHYNDTKRPWQVSCESS